MVWQLDAPSSHTLILLYLSTLQHILLLSAAGCYYTQVLTTEIYSHGTVILVLDFICTFCALDRATTGVCRAVRRLLEGRIGTKRARESTAALSDSAAASRLLYTLRDASGLH